MGVDGFEGVGLGDSSMGDGVPVSSVVRDIPEVYCGAGLVDPALAGDRLEFDGEHWKCVRDAKDPWPVPMLFWLAIVLLSFGLLSAIFSEIGLRKRVDDLQSEVSALVIESEIDALLSVDRLEADDE